MSKLQCPICKYEFTHKVGMEWCPCENSAVDFNSGSELDTKYKRLIGKIAEHNK
jgi:hypothetical protein